MPSRYTASFSTLALALLLSACASGRMAEQVPSPTTVEEQPAEGPDAEAQIAELQERLYEVEPSLAFQNAVATGTRTMEGLPGPDYFQQDATYELEAIVDPAEKELVGTVRIRYTNNAPEPLPQLVVELAQNLHREGVQRGEPVEITGGVDLARVALDGRELTEVTAQIQPGSFLTQNTLLGLFPEQPLAPGETAEIEIDFSFTIPQAGASGRMGYSGDDLFYLGYWYPKMAVYDDVIGWMLDPFTGGAEFYHDHADYSVAITAPAGWLVMSTGELLNPDEVLAPEVAARMREAYASDEPVMIVEPTTQNVTAQQDGLLTWRFEADRVRDVAFHLSQGGFWEAARTPVGDLDNDGEVDYSHINTFWRPEAPLWSEVTRYQQHSITFESQYTGFPYPWPHMTAVEGSGIIGGGMEFPMMTLMGDYNQRGDSALYNVTAHELAHMWVPMIVSINERRYSWIDEGMTTFLENQAREDFFPGPQHFVGDQERYIGVAMSDFEGEMMRRSDFHYPGPAFGVASYSKPASVLRALRGLLGEATFQEAYQSFIETWAYKHAYPYDLFNTFERVSGRELDWFWTSWYYTTDQLDQAIIDVARIDGTVEVTVENQNDIPMPVLLTATLADGTMLEERIPVDPFLAGADTATATFEVGDAEVTRVEIDPERYFPDVDREDNVYTP